MKGNAFAGAAAPRRACLTDCGILPSFSLLTKLTCARANVSTMLYECSKPFERLEESLAVAPSPTVISAIELSVVEVACVDDVVGRLLLPLVC